MVTKTLTQSLGNTILLKTSPIDQVSHPLRCRQGADQKRGNRSMEEAKVEATARSERGEGEKTKTQLLIRNG
jgi:hypothetical protein